jgi:AcrR family transcriptional regulator
MATGDGNLPIWAVPEPADRRPRYSRDQIARAALDIADREGFDLVTMKRIAAELGAATMTLYYYVRAKSDVVALMQDAILAEMLIPAEEFPADWREATTTIARRSRQVLMAHPWSLTSLNEAQFGPNAARHFEQSLAATADTGLPAPARLELIAAVDDYVAGNALHGIEALTRAELAASDPEMVKATIAYWTGQLRPEDFPELTGMYQAGAAAEATESNESAGPPMTPDALTRQFEHGLAALLDGLAARLGIA